MKTRLHLLFEKCFYAPSARRFYWIFECLCELKNLIAKAHVFRVWNRLPQTLLSVISLVEIWSFKEMKYLLFTAEIALFLRLYPVFSSQVDLTSDKEDGSRSRNVTSTQSSRRTLNGQSERNPYGFSSLSGRHSENHHVTQTVDAHATTSSRLHEMTDQSSSSLRKEGDHVNTNHASRSQAKSKERSGDHQEKCSWNGNAERKVGHPQGYGRLFNTRRFR